MKTSNVVGLLVGSALVYLGVACSGGAQTSEVARIFDSGIAEVTGEDILQVVTDALSDAGEVREAKADDTGIAHDAPSPAAPKYVSGTRLKVRTETITSADGSRLETNPYFFDTNFDMKCMPMMLGDKQMHCMPSAEGWEVIGYRDDACSSPLYAGAGDAPAFSSFVDALGQRHGMQRMRSANMLPPNLYVYWLDRGGVCRPGSQVNLQENDRVVWEYVNLPDTSFATMQSTVKEW